MKTERKKRAGAWRLVQAQTLLDLPRHERLGLVVKRRAELRPMLAACAF